MPEKIIDTIPIDAVIPIEVGGGFYARLHQLKAAILASVPEDQRETVIEELRKADSAHPIAYHLQTVLALMRDIEDTAREKKLTKPQTVQVPDESDPNSPG